VSDLTANGAALPPKLRPRILVKRRAKLSRIELEPASVVQLQHDDPRVVRVYNDRLGLEFIIRDASVDHEEASHWERPPLFRLRKFRLAILSVRSTGSIPVVAFLTCRGYVRRGKPHVSRLCAENRGDSPEDHRRSREALSVGFRATQGLSPIRSMSCHIEIPRLTISLP
jgi:hypothetical protein